MAAAILVTGDSISMCCEACVPLKPVYLIDLPGLHNTYYSSIHADLQEQKYVLPFEHIEANGLTTGWQSDKPLDEAGRIAKHVSLVVQTERAGGYCAGGFYTMPNGVVTGAGGR